MTCDQSQSLLHGYLDGELDAARAEEFEQHVQKCSACVAQLEEQEKIRASLKAAQLYERAPESLARRVEREIAATEMDDQWSWIPIWRWVGASAAIVLILAFSYLSVEKVWNRPSGIQQAALTEVIDAHVRSLQPGHLTDVLSTDQHTVKPWFDGKLDYVPPVRDLAENGFPLVGGRLDVLNGRSVAVLIYGRRKHFVNVFVWPAAGDAAGIAATGTFHGYQWNSMTAHGMEYLAISDVSAADLHDLTELLQE
jgi:mycothiol system anti-sigma-R factor